MLIELNGKEIESEPDFHKHIAEAFKVNEYYGNNLNALWDLLSADIERPVHLVWNDSKHSERSMGDSYNKIVKILERTKVQDETFGWSERFTYHLK